MEQRESNPPASPARNPMVHSTPAGSDTSAPLRGFAVAYTVDGTWNLEQIKEDLFDAIGPITPLDTGFTCTPDEFHAGLPEITLDAMARTVRFGLFGPYRERDAAGPILHAANEFSRRYRLDLEPLAYERWEVRADRRGFALVDRVPLGTAIAQDGGRIAHA